MCVFLLGCFHDSSLPSALHGSLCGPCFARHRDRRSVPVDRERACLTYIVTCSELSIAWIGLLSDEGIALRNGLGATALDNAKAFASRAMKEPDAYYKISINEKPLRDSGRFSNR